MALAYIVTLLEYGSEPSVLLLELTDRMVHTGEYTIANVVICEALGRADQIVICRHEFHEAVTILQDIVRDADSLAYQTLRLALRLS